MQVIKKLGRETKKFKLTEEQETETVKDALSPTLWATGMQYTRRATQPIAGLTLPSALERIDADNGASIDTRDYNSHFFARDRDKDISIGHDDFESISKHLDINDIANLRLASKGTKEFIDNAYVVKLKDVSFGVEDLLREDTLVV